MHSSYMGIYDTKCNSIVFDIYIIVYFARKFYLCRHPGYIKCFNLDSSVKEMWVLTWKHKHIHAEVFFLLSLSNIILLYSFKAGLPMLLSSGCFELMVSL